MLYLYANHSFNLFADPSFFQQHYNQVMSIYNAIYESEDVDTDKRESTAVDRSAVTNTYQVY